MSRSGRIPITIPESTEVTMRDNCVFAKGKLGELKFELNELTKGVVLDIGIDYGTSFILTNIPFTGSFAAGMALGFSNG